MKTQIDLLLSTVKSNETKQMLTTAKESIEKMEKKHK